MLTSLSLKKTSRRLATIRRLHHQAESAPAGMFLNEMESFSEPCGAMVVTYIL